MIIHTLITTEELAWSVIFENFPQFQQKAHDPSRLYVYLRLYTVFFVKRIIFAYQQVHYGTGPLWKKQKSTKEKASNIITSWYKRNQFTVYWNTPSKLYTISLSDLHVCLGIEKISYWFNVFLLYDIWPRPRTKTLVLGVINFTTLVDHFLVIITIYSVSLVI